MAWGLAGKDAEHDAGRSSPAGPLPAAAAVIRRLRFLPDLGAAALFSLLALAITWPLTAGMGDRLVSWGDPVFQAWTMAWDWHAWRTAPLRVFDANIFYPYPNTLAYADHLFGQALLVGPVLLATGNAILADNLSVLLALIFSGIAMYLLVLDLTGSRLAGLIAGAAYAFAPARLAHLEHLNLLSAQWLPLALLTARRALRGGSWRWAALLGLVVLLQGLFGLYYFFFMLLLLAIVVGAHLIATRGRRLLAPLARMAICCALAAVLLLPTLLPYQRVHDELGVERTEAELRQWRAIPSDYLAVNPDNRLYGAVLAPRYHRDLERDLFPGGLVVLLALVGLAARRPGLDRCTLLALTLIPVGLSFGLTWHIAGLRVPTPYWLLYRFLPGFEAIRVPARLALLALVGVCGLAGLGADLLLRRARQLAGRVRWRAGGLPLMPGMLAPVVLAALLGLGVMAEAAVVMPLAPPLPVRAAQLHRPDYAWMAAHPAPTIELPMGQGLIATAWPNYWLIFHWNPVVNGYSAFAPPVYYALRDQMATFPSEASIHLLQGMGVRTVVYHADPSRAPSDDPLLRAVGRYPALTQVVSGPDYVYRLAPDPWMWDLARAVPRGQAVALPALGSDPVTFGLLAAILQRGGHTVYGHGALQYWRLRPAPSGTCYVIRPVETGVTSDRGVVTLLTRGGLVLERRAGCPGG